MSIKITLPHPAPQYDYENEAQTRRLLENAFLTTPTPSIGAYHTAVLNISYNEIDPIVDGLFDAVTIAFKFKIWAVDFRSLSGGAGDLVLGVYASSALSFDSYTEISHTSSRPTLSADKRYFDNTLASWAVDHEAYTTLKAEVLGDSDVIIRAQLVFLLERVA